MFWCQLWIFWCQKHPGPTEPPHHEHRSPARPELPCPPPSCKSLVSRRRRPHVGPPPRPATDALLSAAGFEPCTARASQCVPSVVCLPSRARVRTCPRKIWGLGATQPQQPARNGASWSPAGRKFEHSAMTSAICWSACLERYTNRSSKILMNRHVCRKI